MNKCVVNLVIFLFFFALAIFNLNPSAIASSDEPNEVLDKPKPEIITMHESRFWQDPSRIAENTIIVTEEKIGSLPAHNVADVLQYIPGLNIDTGTGFGHPATYSLHSAQPRHVRVMIDGIDFNNQVSGQSALAEIPIENVKQIEIIKGPVSSKWGSALGGIINIVTKDVGDSLIPHGKFTYILSEYKQRRYLGEIYGGFRDFGYYAFGEYAEAGGIRNYDDMLNKNGMVKSSLALLDEMIKVTSSFGYIGADENEGFYPDPAWRWFKQNYISRYGKVRIDFDPSERFHMQVSGKTNHQTVRNYDNFLDRSEFRDKLWGIDFESVLRLREADTLAVGFDSAYDQLKTLNIPTSVSMHSEAFYANYTAVLGPFSLNGGIRYDRHSDFDDQVSPSIGIVYEVPYISDTRVRASFSRGYSAPPLVWIFYNAPFFRSNPDLKPERAWVWEIGLESQPISHFWTKVNLFRSDVSDFINYDFNTMMMKNNQKFRHQGIELETKINPFKGFYITAAGSINDVEDSSTGDNAYSLAIARNSVDLGFLYKHDKGFMANLLANYQRNRVRSPQNHPRENKFIWDFKISQEIPIWKTVSVRSFLNVHNIFNSKFWNDEFYPHPDRYFEFGVECTF